jgi:hypothetical protein
MVIPFLIRVNPIIHKGEQAGHSGQVVPFMTKPLNRLIINTQVESLWIAMSWSNLSAFPEISMPLTARTSCG